MFRGGGNRQSSEEEEKHRLLSTDSSGGLDLAKAKPSDAGFESWLCVCV